jgi:hypothetical protein
MYTPPVASSPPPALRAGFQCLVSQPRPARNWLDLVVNVQILITVLGTPLHHACPAKADTAGRFSASSSVTSSVSLVLRHQLVNLVVDVQ